MSAMGFPKLEQTAPYAKRYKGLFYWDAYWRCWDRIIDIRYGDKECWVVQRVDLLGNSVGPRRNHTSSLWANRFADFPFEVEWQGQTPVRKETRG